MVTIYAFTHLEHEPRIYKNKFSKHKIYELYIGKHISITVPSYYCKLQILIVMSL